MSTIMNTYAGSTNYATEKIDHLIQFIMHQLIINKFTLKRRINLIRPFLHYSVFISTSRLLARNS